MEELQGKTYSIAQASQVLGKSESSIKIYKKLVLDAFKNQPSLVTEPNGSLTEYGLEQLRKAARFIQKGDRFGYVKAVFQANPSLEYPLTDPSQSTQSMGENGDYTSVLRGGSLVRRRSTAITTRFSEFDEGAAQQDLAKIQEDIAAQVGNLDELFTRYGRAKVKQALAEIDLTVEALKSNALAEMGAVSGPKSHNAPQSANAP
ncbi:hypothetical protein [Halomicronema sp. CCY15110]|uniref:hypothetical protein n=1 Tax=Halomicronema sp. CCY15110 TaxID=2767773 RepID=UPI00195100D0|nr:hypothetical protein [Halomicronema sp. CCY15110]